MTKLDTWSEKAPDQFYGCCLAKLREGNEPPELFARSCSGKISPLVWRIPIFVWAASIITWSVVGFWGPRAMFLLYMTHWGLIMIFLESLFGILVCIQKYRGCLNGERSFKNYSTIINALRMINPDEGVFIPGYL